MLDLGEYATFEKRHGGLADTFRIELLKELGAKGDLVPLRGGGHDHL